MANPNKCKFQVLGKDPNDSKKPARFSDDPKIKKQQKMELAACRKGRNMDWINKRKEDVNKLFNKKKDSI
tara:strand:+ start:85 stop:294 length:210 start_codon:yes stop_codon:yes gene_type:complete